MPRVLRNIQFRRVALVDKGANLDVETGDGAHIVLYKRDLGSHERNDLPDSAFAAVWTDEHGNKQRKLPYKHSDGSLDHSHWQNAMARFESTQMPEHVKAEARRKLEAVRPKEKRMKLTDLFKSILSAKDDAERERIKKALETPGSPEHEAAEQQHIDALAALHPDHKTALQSHAASLHKMIESYGPGPHPEGHPVHAMKEMHAKMCKMMGVEGQDTLHKDDNGMNDAEVQKKIDNATAELAKRVQTAESALQVEIEKREQSEMVTLLKSFKHTPFEMDLAKADNDIVKFSKMKKADPAGFQRMVDLFKAAEAQVETSNLLRKQLGSGRSGSNPNSAEEELQKKAEAIIAKGANGMTKEQAFEQACIENPDLVKRYREEQQ